MIHDLITFLNLKSLFVKLVEDFDTNPTPLESPQSEFERKNYDQNTTHWENFGFTQACTGLQES